MHDHDDVDSLPMEPSKCKPSGGTKNVYFYQIRSLYNDFFCMCVMCHVMACLLTCN